jgi:Leucine-rich repeat (LRR) protein
MKVLIPILIGLLVVGCGTTKQPTNTNQGNNTKTKSSKAVPANIVDPIVEKAIRESLKKPKEILTSIDIGEVEALYLHGTQITDAGLKEVAKLQNLNTLVLDNTQITKYGLTHLVRGIKQYQRLTFLSLRNTKVTDEYAAVFRKFFPKCKIVHSYKKPITDPILEKAIREMINERAAQNLGRGKPIKGELTEEHLYDVIGLGFERKQLTEVPKGLEKLPRLIILSLAENQLTSVKGLENLTQLEHLILGNNQLTSVKGLENLTELKGLILYNNPDLTKAQITELQKVLPKCEIEHNAKK